MLHAELDLLEHLVDLTRLLDSISEDIAHLRMSTAFTPQQMLCGRMILADLDECLATIRSAFE